MMVRFSLDASRPRALSSARDERGMILPLTLMVVVILGSLVAVLLALAGMEPQIAANLHGGTEALFAADSGVEYAFGLMRAANAPVVGFGGFLGATYNGTVGQGRSYSVQIVPANPASDSDDTVILDSTGAAPGGATRRIQAIVTGRYIFDDAVATNDDLLVTGSSCVLGNRGGVHSNRNLTISGSSVRVDQQATASGAFAVNGQPTIGGPTGGGFPNHPIPDLQPSSFRSLATIILKANGTATDGAGNPIPIPPEWSFNPGGGGQWSCCSGRDGTNGTLFVETDVHISSSPNSPINPWRLTLITTGNLQITGNPSIAPALDPATGKPLDLQFLAGKDITMGGFPSECTNCLAGLIYAREQFEINGNVPLRGVLMALDAGDSPGSPVRAGRNRLTGSTCVILNGNLRLRGVNGPLRFLSWRIMP